MKIIKEHFIGVMLGLIPVFVIASIFRNNDMLCVYYLEWYATIANTMLMSIGILELIEKLKGDGTCV